MAPTKIALDALIYEAPPIARIHMRAEADRRAKAALLVAAREAEYTAKKPGQKAVAAKAARLAAIDLRIAVEAEKAARLAVEAAYLITANKLRTYQRSVTPAGYIVYDDRGIIIGSSATVDLARADMLRYLKDWQIDLVGDAVDPYNKRDAWIHKSAIKTAPATQALLDAVNSSGGNCEWHRVGGVACTRDERG